MPAGGQTTRKRQRILKKTPTGRGVVAPKSNTFGPYPGSPSVTRALATKRSPGREAPSSGERRQAPELKAGYDARRRAGRQRLRKQAKGLWPGAAELLGAKGKMPRLAFGNDTHGELAHVKRGQHHVYVTPGLEILALKMPSESRKTLLHEWAHVQQKSSVRKKSLVEGGAESFARYAKKRLTGKGLPKESLKNHPYYKYTKRARRHGARYIRSGQFR